MEDETQSIRRELSEAFVTRHIRDVVREIEKAEPSLRAEYLSEGSASVSAELLERMEGSAAAETVECMNGDAVGRILPKINLEKCLNIVARLEEPARDRVLARLDSVVEKEIRDMLVYPLETAGHLMDPRFVGFTPSSRVSEVTKRLKTIRKRRILDVLLINEDGGLAGVIPLQKVFLAEPKTRLSELVSSVPPHVTCMAPRDEVAEIFTNTRATSLPVLSVSGTVLGVIRYESLVQAAREDAMTDLQAMVGVSRDERALSPVLFSVRKRLPWLNINLLTAFLAAAVVGIFEATIAQVTALAVLLPVVAGQSGNTGAQALAVTMRGLALREVRPRQWPRLVLKESISGALNGVAIALVTAIGVFVWSQSLGLCAVIGVSMVISMMIASAAGAAIPVVIMAAGQDPAQSSSIVLTTVTDVMGFLSFLGLASLFVQWL